MTIKNFMSIPYPVRAIHWDGGQSAYSAIAAWCAETNCTLLDWSAETNDLQVDGRRLALDWWVTRNQANDFLGLYSAEHFHQTYRAAP